MISTASRRNIVPFITIVILLLSACKGKNKKEEAMLKLLEQQLQNANRIVNTGTSFALKSLENKSSEPATKERASVWYPKAVRIANLSKTIFDKLELIQHQSTVTKHDAALMLADLLQYKNELLGINTDIKEQFEKNILAPLAPYTNIADSSKFYNDLFSAGKEFSSSVLRMIQNEIKITENKTVHFCDSKVGSMIDVFESWSAIVGQNTTILQPGEKLEINASIGAFNRAAQPKITINNIPVELNESGYASYKIKSPQKPGIYSIPVVITYFDLTTGKEETRKMNVEYTVKACN